MNTVRNLKLLTAILESILSIPFYGGLIVISYLWAPLYIMFILHIITLIIASKYKEPIAGSIVGAITSAIGWIPIVGMVMHFVTAILLWIDFIRVDDDKDDMNL